MLRIVGGRQSGASATLRLVDVPICNAASARWTKPVKPIHVAHQRRPRPVHRLVLRQCTVPIPNWVASDFVHLQQWSAANAIASSISATPPPPSAPRPESCSRRTSWPPGPSRNGSPPISAQDISHRSRPDHVGLRSAADHRRSATGAPHTARRIVGSRPAAPARRRRRPGRRLTLTSSLVTPRAARSAATSHAPRFRRLEPVRLALRGLP